MSRPITLFTARYNQCRTPLWKAGRAPSPDMAFVCGAPTLPGKSYCATCRERLFVRQEVKGRSAEPEVVTPSVPSLAAE